MKILRVEPTGKGTILDINDVQAKEESRCFSTLAEIELGYEVELPLVLTEIMDGREFVLYFTCNENAGNKNRPVMNILPENSDVLYGPAIFTKLIKAESGYTLESLSEEEIDVLQEEMGIQIIREQGE